MSDSDKTDEPTLDFLPALELPPGPDSPVTQVGQLFTEDALALTVAKFSVLESLLRNLTKPIPFSDFVREVLLSIMRVVKSEAGSILEMDHVNQAFFFRAVVGQSSDRITKFLIPAGKGIVGHVAESRQPLVVDNIKENEIHLKSIQNAVGFETRNLIAVPILIRGKVYGVLELLNRVGEENYTKNDVELLNYLCEMAAHAIELRLMIAWASKGASGKNNKGGQAA